MEEQKDNAESAEPQKKNVVMINTTSLAARLVGISECLFYAADI